MILRQHFDPRSLGSLALWLDASDAPPTGTWADKSENSRNAVQLATNNQPTLTANALGGKPALYFDGINDSLSLAFIPISTWTAFAAVSPNTAGTALHIAASATSVLTLSSGSSAAVVTTSGSATTVAALYGSDSRIGAKWESGALKNFYKGYIAEIVVYSSALSESQSNAVSRYLARKWGL